ncbi:MAG: mercuric reductase [Chloroflexota bacterium]|nr:mercuric reductase [Chloroflexota bacterium]
MPQETVDVIVVGAGQGGGPLASAFAKAGRKTMLIERAHAGGTCVNTGCTPTKTMIASGRVAYLAQRAADYGVHVGDISIDMERVRKRKRDMVEMFREGSESGITSTEGLEYLEGEARFVDDMTLEVALNDGGSRTVTAGTIVLNVGERPRELGIDIPAGVTVLDSTSVMELAEAPDHLVVVGGGVIGVEFAQLFRRLGSGVTILQRGGKLLAREDPEISDAVATILTEDGITIEFDASVVALSRSGSGVDVAVERKDGFSFTVKGSDILAAAGRTPNTDSLNLAATGLKTDERGYLETDDRLQTDVAGIFAIGDIRPGPKFTHISYDDYRIIQANLIEDGNRSVNDRPVPYTVFMDPQLGRVGMSEQEAKEQGVPFRVAEIQMSSVARALETDETRGMMKAIVHAETRMILGAAVLGIEGGEVMSMIQIAMMGDLPYTRLREGVFAHPNLSEALNSLFGSFREET